jgi:hypothetical protein
MREAAGETISVARTVFMISAHPAHQLCILIRFHLGVGPNCECTFATIAALRSAVVAGLGHEIAFCEGDRRRTRVAIVATILFKLFISSSVNETRRRGGVVLAIPHTNDILLAGGGEGIT